MNNVNNIIADLIEPIRPAFVERAKRNARVSIDYHVAKFEAAGWDTSKVLTQRQHPVHEGKFAYDTPEYKAATDAYYVTRDYESYLNKFMDLSYKTNQFQQCDKKEARFIASAAIAANKDLDTFIAKLSAKIGDCKAATIDWVTENDEDKDAWFHSVITATLEDGTVERWKTKEKLNHSGYETGGKFYYQWPTTKMKK